MTRRERAAVGRRELLRVEQTAQKVARLEAELLRAREQLRRDVGAAHDSGESVAEIARRLKVTRTRVYQLLERRE